MAVAECRRRRRSSRREENDKEEGGAGPGAATTVRCNGQQQQRTSVLHTSADRENLPRANIQTLSIRASSLVWHTTRRAVAVQEGGESLLCLSCLASSRSSCHSLLPAQLVSPSCASPCAPFIQQQGNPFAAAMEDSDDDSAAGSAEEEPKYSSVLEAAVAADWHALEARLAAHPEEARSKLHCHPLHVAVAKGAPLQTVEALLEAAGESRLLAASATDDMSRLPLHHVTSMTPVEGA